MVEQAVIEALVSDPPAYDAAVRAAGGLAGGLGGRWTVSMDSARPGQEANGGREPEAAVRRSLRGRRSVITARVGGRIVVAVQGEGGVEPGEECSTLQVGEGAAHDGPAGFRRSLDEATEALMIARRRGLDRARFADLALDRLLLGSVSAPDFSAEVLAPLDALRGTKSQVALETLVAYLTASGSVTAAARMLHLHPQSLRYRLSRLPVTVQQSLKHPRERLTIELALEARTLVPPRPSPGSDELDPPQP